MKKSMLLVLFLCLLAVVGATATVVSLVPSAPVAGPRVVVRSSTSTSLVDQGKSALQAHAPGSILAARDLFAQAVAADPTDQEANLLYGVTRVFALFEQVQGTSTDGLSSVQQILQLSGFSFENFGLYNTQGTPPGGFVQGMPRSGAVLDFVKASVLPELVAALGNLNSVTSTFAGSTLAPADINKSYGQNITVDYADALVIKALLNAAICNMNLLMVYGLDVNIPDIAAKPKELLTYQALFADASFLAVKDTTSLANGKSALLSFLDTYQNYALPALQSRTGAVHHLFVVDAAVSNEPFDLQTGTLTDLNTTLTEIGNSLKGPVTFTGGGLAQDRTVDLSRFFAANGLNIRSQLGNCSSGSKLNDPTIGGLFPATLSFYPKLVAQNGADLLGVACPGTPYGTPKISVDPGNFYFSEYPGSSTGPAAVTINNYGTGALQITSPIALSGPGSANFTVNAGSCSSLAPLLTAGTSCSVTVDLKRPVTATGSTSATLNLASNDLTNGLQTVSLNGWLNGSTGGSISGIVTDATTGGGLQGVTVSLYDNSATPVFLKSTTTNSTGGYTLNALAAGSYKLHFISPSAGYVSRWYNGKPNSVSGDLIALAANANINNVSVALLQAPVTLSWGGVWQRTSSSGATYDAFDVGINGSSTTLSPLKVRVDGPAGFSPYTFSESDKIPYLAGKFSLFKTYTSGKLPAGVYTVSLTDANGNVSYRSSARPATPKTLPMVDSRTIQWQRKADGSYRFSWAPVNDTQGYYYRLRVSLNDASSHNGYSTPVVLSERTAFAYIDVPQVAGSVNPLSDGTPYLVRVEVLDAPTPDLVTSRTDSAYVSFTPQGSDYNPERLLVNWVMLDNRTDSDGSLTTEIDLSVSNPAAVSSVELRDSTGALVYTFLPGDRSNLEFWKKLTTPLAPGSYTLHFVANGVDHYCYLTLTAPVSYPIPGTTGMQAEDQGNGYLRFSWANVDHTGPLNYRVMVYDTITGPQLNGYVYYSNPQNGNYVDVPKNALGDLATKQWRVEIWDSAYATTLRNRVNGPLVALNPVAYDPARPVLGSWRIRSMTSSAGVTRSQVLISASASQAPLASLLVTGPGGYSRELLASPARYSTLYGAYALEEPGAPAAGLYTITARDAAGRSSLRYLYQPAPHPVPPVDFTTFHSSVEANGDTRISWAPVLSDVPVWYQLALYSTSDQNGDGLLDAASATVTAAVDVNYDGYSESVGVYPLASVTIPAATVLPASTMFRITAIDGGTSYVNLGGVQTLSTDTIHNASQSVMVKNEAVGYTYAALSDADGDGFASDLDSNDSSASVYPFSSGNDGLAPSVTSTSPANGTSGVSPSSSICANFDKPIDPRTLAGNFTVSNGVTGTIRYQVAGSASTMAASACLTPAAPLPANVQFSAAIGAAVLDQAGNHLAPYAWSFSTPATPTCSASPAAGSYPAPQTVTLTANDATASIYYTTDGSAPSYPMTGSTRLYVAPIAVSGSTTLSYLARNASGNGAPGSAAYTMSAPAAPGWIQADPGAGQVALSWGPSAGALSYNVYLTAVSSPLLTSGTAFKDALASGFYGLSPNGNNGAGTYYYQSGLDILNQDGATLSESTSSWDSVAQLWSAPVPSSGNGNHLRLSSTGWVAVSDDLPANISFNSDGSATATAKGDQSQQRMTLSIVELAGVPIAAAGVSTAIPILPGALVFPAGSRRYDMTQTQITESYRTSGQNSVQSSVTTLAGIPGSYPTLSVKSQSDGPYQFQVTFGSGNSVNIAQQYNGGAPSYIGSGSWDIRNVLGEEILVVTIPAALRASYKIGPDPFFAIVNGVITGGEHYAVGYLAADSTFNQAAMDHLKLNLNPVPTAQVNLPIAQTSSSSYLHGGLAVNDNYSYLVRGSNAVGEGTGMAASATVTGAGSPDTTPPVITSFTLPALSSSLKVPVSSLQGSDNLAVSAFLLSENPAKPAAGAAGWVTSTPTFFTFASFGSRTLYAWAKDVAGNISASASAPVTINLTFPLTVQDAGSGSGTVTSLAPNPGISCLTGNPAGCSFTFGSGNPVDLHPSASTNSSFTGWSGSVPAGCAGAGDCVVTMNAAQSVIATFAANPATVRIDGVSTPYYSPDAALDAITTQGQTVRALNDVFPAITMTSPVAIILKGGYTDSAFSLRTSTSFTVIQNSLTISKGTLRVERLVVN